MLRLPELPPGDAVRVTVDDPVTGAVPLSGRLHVPESATTLVVALHGLGGSVDSAYLRAFAREAIGAGFAVLRANARGADLEAGDFHHAGLTGDLDTLLAAPEIAPFARRVLVGFSLGGQTALRWAAERAASARERGVVGVAAVCAPLDLERGASALDRRGAWLYRRYLLPRLLRIADAADRGGSLPPGVAPRARRRAVRGIREFDRLVVAPRFGFASAEDYYAKVSVAPLLPRIAVPAWIVAAENDPMVPPPTVRPALANVSPTTTVTWAKRGGHVGFPADLDLGRSAPLGLHPQLVDWIRSLPPAP
jgi:predicted alpha/beta-fold hydrolase